ncbi:tRNA threonylcarbamoyladenosine dehydratase [Terrisporobacter sp.]|uniref:tRNA threonylcarbamoyladenosine dehydratase n=1 Tax=Terrisporobacter sp. TaxID=1965305 RepID=UPI00262A8F6A|nr:tRNA threonylcarbamoyladenosine dehydratase [Terrisporobacter sp.]
MENIFTTRTSLIVGEDNIKRLKNSKVLVIGVGGVGSFAVEALVRAGVGNITIVDYADVEITDFNRQLPGLHSNLGKNKVEVVKERLLDINPHLNIKGIKDIFNEESSNEILNDDYDYVIDAIDMVSSKIHLVEECIKRNFKLISSMGMGNKLDPTKIEISDISKTHTCPLAKVMCKELRDRNINHLTVVFSTEQPIEVKEKISNGHRILPGSMSFLSPCGGMVMASFVIKDLINI